MMLGWGDRLLSLIPAEAECSSLATLLKLLVEPVGTRRPDRISLPIEMIVGEIPASANLLDASSV